jgi:hypothetical protein
VCIKASTKNDRNFDLKLLETKIDICRVGKGVRNSIFSKVLFENYEASSSSGKLFCPILKGETQITNFTITSNFLPPFPRVLFPTGVLPFKLVCTHHIKVDKIKKLVRAYTYTLTGAVFDGPIAN